MKRISIFFLLIIINTAIFGQELSTEVLTKETQSNLTPKDVLAELKAGNERFLSGKRINRDYHAQIEATSQGQYPKAAILSCIDSRVPVEIIFDEGIGDVFVGRVAGNIENTDLLGSFEYAVAVAGSKLVLVLGHSNCGAVKGAVDYSTIEPMGIENLNSLLRNINPAVDAVLEKDEERTSKNHELVDKAIEENVVLTMNRIREKSPTLKQLETEGKLMIVGGVYDVETGKIHWLE